MTTPICSRAQSPSCDGRDVQPVVIRGGFVEQRTAMCAACRASAARMGMDVALSAQRSARKAAAA